MNRSTWPFALCTMSWAALVAAALPETMMVEVKEGPSLPTGVASHAGGIVEGRIVSAGGTSWTDNRQRKVWHRECYILNGDAWQPGPPLPHPLSDPASAWNETGLYLAGGSNGTQETDEVFRLASVGSDAAWQPLKKLPQTVSGASAVCIAETLFVAGGMSGGKPSNQLWSLDLSRPDAAWRVCARFPGPGRSHGAMTAVEGSPHYFGGFILHDTGELQILEDAYRYDTETDTWSRLEQIQVPGYAWRLSPIDAHQLLVTGRVRAREDIRTDVEVLDLRDGSLRTVGHLAGPTCVATQVRIGPAKWCVFGGEPNAQRNRTATVNFLTLSRE